MNKLFTLIGAVLFMALNSNLDAQVLHVVNAGGTPDANTPDPYFSPQFLTINLGDTVRWVNVQGWHSIDGTQASFPDNPATFTSGDAGSGWTYEFKFEVAGVYDYECPVGDHGLTQFGTVTVLDIANDVNEIDAIMFDFYPNPASSFLTIESKNAESYKLISVNGQVVKEGSLNNGKTKVSINEIQGGNYILQVSNTNGTKSERIVIQ